MISLIESYLKVQNQTHKRLIFETVNSVSYSLYVSIQLPHIERSSFPLERPIGNCSTKKCAAIYSESHSPRNKSCHKYTNLLMLHVAVHSVATRRKTLLNLPRQTIKKQRLRKINQPQMTQCSISEF